jgi:aminoglycoside 3-N-acetyltransferase
LCIHSSFKTLQPLIADPDRFIDILLGKGCTLIVPAHNYTRRIAYSSGIIIKQNGSESRDTHMNGAMNKRFNPENVTISYEMGIISKKIVERHNSVLGLHPENAFAGIGPEAAWIIQSQTPWNVYAPYDVLMNDKKAFLLLIGVNLAKATPVHYAEMEAGRNPFIRWYRDAGGKVRPMRVGGCSDGFGNCESCVKSIEKQVKIGTSEWRIYPFRPFIKKLADCIQKKPGITFCHNQDCLRCRDGIKGGPYYAFPELSHISRENATCKR